MKALVSWRGRLLLTEGKIVVSSVSYLFLKRVGVYVCACVCIRTHARMHFTDGVIGCEPRGRDERYKTGALRPSIKGIKPYL